MSAPIDYATPAPNADSGRARVRVVADDGTVGDWRDGLVYDAMPNGGSRLSRNVANVITILRFDPAWAGRVAFDDFAGSVVLTQAPPWHEHDAPGAAKLGEWTDEDTTRAAAWLARHWTLKVGSAVVAEAIRVVAKATPIHPVRAYLDGLAWDGTRRLDTWPITYLGAADSAYTRNVGRWWAVSAIARVYEPGCKADHAIILEGPQGIGKSTTLRLLGGQWFTDTAIDLDSKDAYLAMRGRWIVELAELEGLARSEAARVKAFFSSPVDSYRPPYGREPVQVPRQCVFAGSVNHGAYLKDETGGRRFWPIACGSIDLDALRRDRDQLWAEAREAYRGGAHWWPETAADAEACAEVQAERYQADEWETAIADWIGTATEPITVARVLEHALELPAGRWTRADQMRASACLVRLGYDRARRTLPTGRREWVYVKADGGSR